MEKVDVIIPTFKPDQKLNNLLDAITKQSVTVSHIFIMNTEQGYFQTCLGDKEEDFLKKFPSVVLNHLSVNEFDHGATRDKAFSFTNEEIVICLTQDVEIQDSELFSKLISPLKEDYVAVAYARQLPNANANEVEKYTREFNYPNKSRIKTEKDLEVLGIKTFFCSNVCAAYKKEVYQKLGGFTKKTIFNEDMIFAAKAVKAGYGIAYVAEAEVIHSHKYSNMQQLHRNFDNAVSQADHSELFEGIKAESEGIRLVKQTAKHLCKVKKGYLVLPMIITSGFKYI